MSKQPSSQMKYRMIVVMLGMVLVGFVVVLHQLFVLQIVEGEEWQSEALDHQLRSQEIAPKRGVIYDTNMTPLARSATVYTVCISPAEILTGSNSEEKKQEVSDTLRTMLGVDPALVEQKMKNTGSFYERVKTKVEKPEADALMEFVSENNVKGIFLEEDTRRYYPYGNFAATVLGFTNNDNVGAYGLESYYNNVLAGTPGRSVSMRNSVGVTMPLEYDETYPAQDGNSLVLTLDEKIQHYLEKNLETAVNEHRVSNRATGIVMNVKTGAILAMASKPDFDPNDPYTIFSETKREELEALNTVEQKEQYQTAKQQAQYAQWRNPAVSDPYEPGSVFKIITASGALESGAVDHNTGFYCPGYKEVAGRIQRCWVYGQKGIGHGQQNIADAIRNSCNPAFIEIGQRMGAKVFYENFSNFGLTEGTGIDLPGEAGSIYYTDKNMGLAELSSSSFGQTFKVTPIQLITACCAAVNGGKLMQPYIVQQIIDSEGNVVSSTEPVVKRQVISEAVSKDMCEMLEAVVTEGSGSAARVPGYRIGGKTGTSEKIDKYEQERKENPNAQMKYVLSFFGFAPVDDPEIACLVLLDEADVPNPYGSTVAAPVVGAVLADVLPYVGIEPQYTEEELENVATTTPLLLDKDIHEAESILRIAGLKYQIVGEGTTVVKQVPGYQEPLPKDGRVVIYTEEFTDEQMVEVPNVVGMTVAQANQTLVDQYSLNISVSGTGLEGSSGRAVSQNPVAGTKVAPGTIVAVEFQDPNLAG